MTNHSLVTSFMVNCKRVFIVQIPMIAEVFHYTFLKIHRIQQIFVCNLSKSSTAIVLHSIVMRPLRFLCAFPSLINLVFCECSRMVSQYIYFKQLTSELKPTCQLRTTDSRGLHLLLFLSSSLMETAEYSYRIV